LAQRKDQQTRCTALDRITIVLDLHLKLSFKWHMPKTLPSLESLRVLAACVRLGNFSRAAAELGITPTAVSQRMRALEGQIGVTLFRRHGPKLTTTDRARALGQRVDEALALMHGAVDDCRRIKHPLRVTCAPTFAARWLVPRLMSYQGLPGAEPIVLDATQTLSPQGSFDVAIRNGLGPWPGYASVRLLSDEATPMLSPKLIAPGTRMTPKQLLRVPLIPDSRWATWFKLAGLPTAKPRFVAARFPNYVLEAQAAVEGIGAALLSPQLFSQFTAQGTLIAPFSLSVEGPSSYWLLWTPESANANFLAWMKAQFAVT
jgi:LysR family transcriptional regulator, glycine cleavage system transcriptional activator